MLEILEIAENNSWRLVFDFANLKVSVEVETANNTYTVSAPITEIVEFMKALELVEKYS